jgi:hypothetical protein
VYPAGVRADDEISCGGVILPLDDSALVVSIHWDALHARLLDFRPGIELFSRAVRRVRSEL